MNKKQVFYVDYDENGDEVKTPKGRGRTKLGYKQGEDGNWYMDDSFDMEAHLEQQKEKYRKEHFYIVQDKNGIEISRNKAGRGKPSKKYTKGDDGNFYMTVEDTTSTDLKNLTKIKETAGNESTV